VAGYPLGNYQAAPQAAARITPSQGLQARTDTTIVLGPRLQPIDVAMALGQMAERHGESG
jgi:hypothetical protein